MRYSVIKKILPACLLLNAVFLTGYGQTNKPSSLTQVPASANSAVTTPGAYNAAGQSPLINYVRQRDAMGRITDAIVFDNAGYIEVKQTTSYLDGLGRPLQTVQRQMTSGNSPQDIVTPVLFDA